MGLTLHFPNSVARPQRLTNFPKHQAESHFHGIDPKPTNDDYHAEICHKLKSLGEYSLLETISNCGSQWTVRVCRGCRTATKFQNHCDTTWCPRCQPRIARERRLSIEFWAKMIRQPKHVVLTCRNTKFLTAKHVRDIKSAFAKLRKSTFASNWRGGCWSLEVTNESHGWHLHIHALIDATWVDARVLAQHWGRLVGQNFAIVKVRDCRDKSYLAEVCKYAVKGSQMAKWSAHEMVQFVNAMQGGRTFGVFGSLFKDRAAWETWKSNRPDHKPTCECGCDKFRYLSLNEYDWEQLVTEHDPPTIPPPPPQIEIAWAN